MFLLQAFSVIFNVHGFYRGFTTGLILRSALIHSLFSRSLKLTNRAKTKGGLTTGKLVAMISTDVSRIDFCMGYFHLAWTSPVQILVCFALLVYNLGYSALPGFALCGLMTPVQGHITKVLFLLRFAFQPSGFRVI
jgi:ATP-binding cassette subfamily C (CFTR/MRP) protein 1